MAQDERDLGRGIERPQRPQAGRQQALRWLVLRQGGEEPGLAGCQPAARQAGRPVGLRRSTANLTETLILEGLAGDDRWLGGVQVCDTLNGYEACQEAELFFFNDVVNGPVRQAALSAAVADEAYWSVAIVVDQGIVGATVPYTVTAYDAYGNAVQQSVLLLVDTLAPTVTLTAPPATQIDFDGAFSFSGNATDRSGVSALALEVLTPLGEYVTYPLTLDSPGAVSTGWQYVLSPGEEFAIPGDYTYVILAYDAVGNAREIGPYRLTVGALARPWLNDPVFVAASNDLWAGFAPGASVYMQVEFDDADLSLGDSITATADPFPAWLTMTRLDERTVEISGTVPLTITQAPRPAVSVGDRTAPAEISSTAAVTPVLQINVGLTLTDRTGRQAYRSWPFEMVLPSGPIRIFVPFVAYQPEPAADRKVYLPLISR